METIKEYREALKHIMNSVEGKDLEKIRKDLRLLDKLVDEFDYLRTDFINISRQIAIADMKVTKH